MTFAGKRVFATLGTVLLTLGVSTISGQVQGPSQASAPQATAATDQGMPRVKVTAGRSLVLPTEFNITRIALTNPADADPVVV